MSEEKRQWIVEERIDRLPEVGEAYGHLFLEFPGTPIPVKVVGSRIPTPDEVRAACPEHIVALLKEAVRLRDQINTLGESAPYREVIDNRSAYESITSQLGMWAEALLDRIASQPAPAERPKVTREQIFEVVNQRCNHAACGACNLTTDEIMRLSEGR